jgi:hypothetical protein
MPTQGRDGEAPLGPESMDQGTGARIVSIQEWCSDSTQKACVVPCDRRGKAFHPNHYAGWSARDTTQWPRCSMS